MMTAQTAALSKKIAAEKSAAVLDTLRSWAVGEGCWSDELEAEFQAKFKALKERWK